MYPPTRNCLHFPTGDTMILRFQSSIDHSTRRRKACHGGVTGRLTAHQLDTLQKKKKKTLRLPSHLLRAGSARRRRREAVNDRTTGSQDLSCNGMRRRRRSDTSTRRDGTARRHPARVRGVLLGRVARPTTTKKNRSVPSCWPAGGPEIPSSESSGRGQVECGETNKTFGKPRKRARSEKCANNVQANHGECDSVELFAVDLALMALFCLSVCQTAAIYELTTPG